VRTAAAGEQCLAADQVLDASQPDKTAVSLTPYFAVLEDASLTLTLADVQSRYCG